MTDVDVLAAKLRPLMPQEVARWLRMRASSDPDTARLVEQQILGAARRVLGDCDNQILLSLPPQRAVTPKAGEAGSLHLGTIVYAGDRGEAAIPLNDMLQHVAIFGRSGAGKTNAVFHILLQLAQRGVPFLFLDWKRTARHLVPLMAIRPNTYTAGRSISPLVFNPFTPPPALEPATYVGLLVDVLADAYDLGDGAVSVLQRAIHGCYTEGNLAPTAEQILERIIAAAPKGRAAGWTASATRALQSIQFAGIASGGAVSQTDLVQRLLSESTIIELDGLSAASKRFLIPMLCLWLYYQRLGAPDREKLTLVIVVEEAHNVMLREQRRGGESVMSMLMRQCREIGIGMMLVDQHPHLISSAALGNAAVTLVLNLKDPSDLAKAAGLCAVGEADKRCFTMLPVGHAVVKMQNRWHRPFLVRLPLVTVDKGRVTDDQLRQWLGESDNSKSHRAGSAGSVGSVAGSGNMGQVPAVAGLLDEDALRFLEDVASHADDGVRDRYHRLGLSGAKGHGAKLALIAGAWLEQQFIRLGNTRKAVLRPMPIARELLGLAKQAGGEGSVAHEYWRRWYARTLEAHGHHVRIEQPRLGGRIDVLARHGDRLLAVEIETGKSDVVKNVRGCLLAGIVHVLVVATDKPAFTIVERRLAAAGLLVPQRVAVVLAPAMPPTAWGSAPGSDGNAARECLDLEDQPAGSGERLDSHETGRFLMDGRDKPSSSDGRVARERRP